MMFQVRTTHEDLVGQKFGRLTVAALANRASAVCRCECGAERTVEVRRLLRGHTKSCGCYYMERLRTHGRSRDAKGRMSKAYHAWCSMKERCLNQASKSYPLYGGRGIHVCSQWANSFEQFLEDMGEPMKGQSLDRIDNNGDYEPGNCRWADVLTQSNNRRVTTRLSFAGKTQGVTQWARETGLSAHVIRNRLRKQWPIEKVLTQPLDRSKSHVLRKNNRA